MSQLSNHTDLKNRLIQSFSSQPEVYAIYLFGNEAAGKIDAYSDVDMVVCTSDPARTWHSYDAILTAISPIRQRLLIISQENDFAEMVMFKNYSPYQKADLSLCDNIQKKSAFTPFLTAYQDSARFSAPRTSLPIIPKRRTVSHEINETLFSVPRFTKCLYRNDFDMYRRWKAITSDFLVLLYEKYFGWREEVTQRILRPMEAKKLYHTLTPEDKNRLETIFPLTGQVDLAKSFCQCIDFYLDTAIQKSHALHIPVQDDFIAYMREFTHTETKN